MPLRKKGERRFKGPWASLEQVYKSRRKRNLGEAESCQLDPQPSSH